MVRAGLLGVVTLTLLGLWLFRGNLGSSGLPEALAPAQAQTTETRPGWTPKTAREACLSLSYMAVRGANVEDMLFTRPARHQGKVWTLEGVLRLSGARDGLKQSTFQCRFTPDSDEFGAQPSSLLYFPHDLDLEEKTRR